MPSLTEQLPDSKSMKGNTFMELVGLEWIKWFGNCHVGIFPISNCRMHAGPVKCLCLSDDHLILSGSSLGSITVSGISSDQRVATLRSTDSTGFIVFPLSCLTLLMPFSFWYSVGICLLQFILSLVIFPPVMTIIGFGFLPFKYCYKMPFKYTWGQLLPICSSSLFVSIIFMGSKMLEIFFQFLKKVATFCLCSLSKYIGLNQFLWRYQVIVLCLQ